MSDDIEKKASSSMENGFITEEKTSEVVTSKFAWYDNIMSMFKAETRGIERVPEDERTDESIWSAASMWLSANMVIATFSLGALSYPAFGLDFGTAVLVIFFFNLLGVLPVAFFSCFGAKFGLRQMILSRFLVGDFAMRIFAFINCVACVGWGAVNIMASAQLLHIVNDNCLPPWAGCLILVVLTIMVTFFGYTAIHLYEKWSWVPNVVCFIAIIARMKISGNFEAGHWGTGKDFAGGVLSFGGTVFGFAAGWTTYAADYTVYMKVDSNPYKTFFAVMAGLCIPLFFTMVLGAACVTGIKTDEAWAAMYDEYSIGGLVYSILVTDSLHGFGQFLCVLLGLSTVSNNIPNMYSIAMCAQAFWGPLRKVPRVVWTLLGNCLTLAICIPAYYSFADVMDNFMNLIGYYLAIYDAMSLSEHFIYRKGFGGYNIEDYLDRSKTPIGIAGTIGFCFGAAGVVLGMDQVWYVGAISKQIGAAGGDIGFELAASFSFIAYNIVRPFELKYCGR
ncbi:unnamed protein product [Kuraishia capsulata CBS 1993]|uniref:Purine-cytosine permease n=1 Tax=Kuraishia capsulata CBS 1993 TaxID=1382522 RepID=W6MFU0_9ASCO|nr:uncharacterized protein KUCA_T00000755001 [Kuraishia capsulata CBS 1993]CDK24789.1 unnamed protein product [Kuraishia capsulata CBS 1993]